MRVLLAERSSQFITKWPCSEGGRYSHPEAHYEAHCFNQKESSNDDAVATRRHSFHHCDSPDGRKPRPRSLLSLIFPGGVMGLFPVKVHLMSCTSYALTQGVLGRIDRATDTGPWGRTHAFIEGIKTNQSLDFRLRS